jgi:hypothetical protein
LADFKFRESFEKIGKVFVQGLSKRMKQQTGVDGQTYSPPEESTLKARRRMKGKASSASVKRLVVTNELSNEAFAYVAGDIGVKVFARNVSHRNGLSYQRLIEYNSKGQSLVNSDIKNPPLVFPTNKNEVMMMENEMEVAKRIFATDAKAQMRKMAVMNLKVKLNIG